MINHLCGSVFMTSDNVLTYDEEKKQILRKAQHLTNAQVMDVFREGDLITICYQLDGEEQALVYNTKKGVLM